jgi:hypothetical protein
VRTLLLLLLAAAGCSSPPEPPVPQSPGHHYPHLFGQRYRTKVDLYLFSSEDTERQYVAREHVGRAFREWKVVEVVPAGAELTILSETHEVTAASGIRDKEGYPMGFICRLSYGAKQVEPVMSEFIQAAERAPHQTPNQRIDESIAVPVKE